MPRKESRNLHSHTFFCSHKGSLWCLIYDRHTNMYVSYMMDTSLLNLCTFVFVRKPLLVCCFFFLQSSSLQLWSSILEVKPQQLVENFEQNYGSFLEGGFFQPLGWEGRFGRVGSQRGRLPWFFQIWRCCCLVVKPVKLLMHGLPVYLGGGLCVSNLAVRNVFNEAFAAGRIWSTILLAS